MNFSKGILTTVLAFMVCVFCSSPVMAATFSDTAGHWAEKYIEEAASEGLLSGYTDGTFHPDSYITRAEMATIFSRMLALENVAANSFKDLSNSWYSEAMLQNVYAGIINGYSDGTIRPNNNITRQEAAKMMGNCLSDGDTGGDLSMFSDKNDIQDWAKGAVALCVSNGYFLGDQNQNFNPNGRLTRAEAATVLVRMANSEDIVSATNTSDDYYDNYSQLAADKVNGVDYKIDTQDTASNIVVIAIHGGGIEPGTTELAKEVAGNEYDYYSFAGIMKSGNSILHITSSNFDEPIARSLVMKSQETISIHGFSSSEKITYVGGLDTNLVKKVKESLTSAGFTVADAPSYLAGSNPVNICNSNSIKAGVQIELSTALRASFFKDLTSSGRKVTTTEFTKYANALISALN